MKGLSVGQLVEALEAVGFQASLQGAAQVSLAAVEVDSRKVGPGALFVAVRGAAVDGHRFIERALGAGASALMVDRDWQGDAGDVPVVRVDDTRQALPHAAGAFFDHPSRDLTVVGLTGTNGKTTTTWLLEKIALAAGMSPGVIGTIHYSFAGKVIKGLNTTPGAFELQSLLAQMRDAGVDVVFMEVSSHGLVTHRVDGLALKVGAFLNLSQDHLDFHGTMEAYAEAKSRLFSHVLPYSARTLGQDVQAVIHVGDAAGAQMLGAVDEGCTRVLRFDGRPGAQASAQVMGVAKAQMDGQGTTVSFEGAGHGPLEVRTGMLGVVNVENVTAAVAVARALGIADEAIARGLGNVAGVPGRLERVIPDEEGQGPLVVVDYAHTPDAVARALESLRPLTQGRLLTVLGCGGDRDRSKRPLMAKAALDAGELLIATSDNPRGEDPDAILDDMLAGSDAVGPSVGWTAGGAGGGVLRLVERPEAIAAAVGLAGDDDVVLVAGKGHETYQEVEGHRYAMSDVEQSRLALGGPSGRPVIETIPLEALAGGCKARVTGTVPEQWRGINAGVSSDSRAMVPGAIFVALRGERFDGHRFLSQAVAAGAQALVVEGAEGSRLAAEAWSGAGVEGVTLEVDDTLVALGDLASVVLARLRAVKPWFTAVGITGSNGKTTTKELASALCLAWLGLGSERVHRNPGNHNNLIGVPQTVFGLRWGHDVLISEMGMNAYGEISRLVEIVEPEVRVLTGVAAAHLEGLGSIEGVLKAKSEIFEGMAAEQVAVVPSKLLEKVLEKIPEHARVAVFGQVDGEWGQGRLSVGASVVSSALVGEHEEVVIEARWFDSGDRWGKLGVANTSGAGRWSVVSGLMGAHNGANLSAALLAAAAIGDRLGVVQGRDQQEAGLDLRSALELPSGRLVLRVGDAQRYGTGKLEVLDDCYNANPGSMEAGLGVLVEQASRRGAVAVAVLGDMFELGQQARALHKEVGAVDAVSQLGALITFGDLAESIGLGAKEAGHIALDKVTHIDGQDQSAVADVAAAVKGAVSGASSALVLVKGSRGMRMERIVEALIQGAG